MRADASCVLIHDAFPKAQHHALVLPREAGLHDVTSLTRGHLPLLAHMQARVGRPLSGSIVCTL
jgi:hypothetical protein